MKEKMCHKVTDWNKCCIMKQKEEGQHPVLSAAEQYRGKEV